MGITDKLKGLFGEKAPKKKAAGSKPSSLPSKSKDEGYQMAKDKAEVRQYQEKINHMLKDPANQKKAALIISQLINETPLNKKSSQKKKDDSKKSA